MAINPQKLLPPSKNSSAIVAKKTMVPSKFLRKTEESQRISSSIEKLSKETSSYEIEKLDENIIQIKTKVIDVDKFLKGSVASDKKQLDEKRKSYEKERATKKEDALEKKAKKEEPTGKLPSLPKLGFLDWIKNFITNVILGYFAVRLLEHLPKLKGVLNVAGAAFDFVIDWGGKILNGLVSFIDWGYKAYDATRGFIKNLFGKGGVKEFDQLSSLLNQFLNLAIIAGMVTAGSRGKGAGGPTKTKPGSTGKPSSSFRRKPKVTTGRGGKPRFKVPGTRPKVTFGGGGQKGITRIIGRGLGKVPIVGGLIDFAINLALGEKPGRAAAKAVGATAGAALGTLVPIPIAGTILGGILGDIAGGTLYDALMPKSKMAGGGRVSREGETQGRVGRTVRGAFSKSKKGKSKRKLSPRKPTEVEFSSPGADVGGEEKLFGIFPNPLKMLQNAVDVINPFKVVENTGKNLGKTDYFGPILAITSKITLGQKPSQQDYERVGIGINLLFADGINKGKLVGGVAAAFAEGGLVDPKTLDAISSGGDITKWVASTFKDATESNAQRTLREIKENANKKEITEESPEGTAPGGGEGGEGFEVGPAGGSGDKLTMARNLMRDLKLTAAQAAGIVGNMAAESGVENARPQGSPPGTKAPLKVDGVTGYGLVQWTSKGRQQALANFAKSKGADLSKPLSMNIEYQFFLKEFQGAYGNVLKQLRQAQDVKTASTIFMQQYEVPAGYKTNSKIMERYNMSKPIYDRLSKGEGKATEGAGTFIGSRPSGTGGSYTQLSNNPDAKRGSKLAGELGRFLDSKGLGKWGSGVHQHPEHPPWSPETGHSPGSLHYASKGARAIDIGGYGPNLFRSKGYSGVDDQTQIIAAINQFNKMKGVKPVQLLKEGYPGHADHVHVAYEKGGETLDGPHLAMIGEKGKEIVIDNNSTVSDPQVKNMLLAINQASNRKSVIDAIRQYAPYDVGFDDEIIVVNDDSNDISSYEEEQSSPTIILGDSVYYDPFESLDVIG